MSKTKVLFLFFILILSSKIMIAQAEVERIIINEIYLDKDKPNESWIELYNPTKEVLYLEKLWLSTIGPTNLLDEKGTGKVIVKLEPNDYLLLYSDQNNGWKNKEKTYPVKYLNYLNDGGIFTVKTKGKGIAGSDLIRFGKSAITENEAVSVIQVIPWCTNSISYSKKHNSKNVGTDFYSSEATPLKKNK